MNEAAEARKLIDELTAKIINAQNKFAAYQNSLEDRRRADSVKAYGELQDTILPMVREREAIIKRLAKIEAVKTPAPIIVSKGK